jgi:predicted phosphodiesterase
LFKREKSAFKPGEPSREERVMLDPGEIFGVVASSHGDSIAHQAILDELEGRGARVVFHAGDITGEAVDPTGCVLRSFGRNRHCVQGNHDVLAVGEEHVHEYDPRVKRTAELTAMGLTPEAAEQLRNAPARVETPSLVIVHESVSPPYYAKRSKKRRKSHGWDSGSSSDENTTAVCYGRIDRPHFIGSDHAAYAIVGEPLLRIWKPRPGDEVIVPRCSVISVPSIAFSRDDDYDCGGILGTVLEDGRLRLLFLSITPSSRSELYPV